MNSILLIGAVVLGLSVCLSAGSVSAQTDDKHPVVILDTSLRSDHPGTRPGKSPDHRR